MNAEYVEIYDFLSKIKRLTTNKYYDMVSVYGESLVNKVIDDMIVDDENNVSKFEFYFSDGLYSDSKEMNGFRCYLNDISMFSLIDSNEVKLLGREISDIVKRMNVIFSLICDDKLFNKWNGGDGRKYITSIIDKIDFYLFNSHDEKLSLELEELKREFIIKRDKIVLGNLRFVIYVARPYYRVDISFNELVQAGNFGLMRAAESYDPDKYDVLFTTYAYSWIKHSIVRTVKNFLYSVDVSDKLLYRRYDDSYDVLSKNIDREFRYLDSDKYMDISVSNVFSLDMSYISSSFLDSEISNDCFCDEIIDSNVSVEDDYIYREVLCMIRDILYSDDISEKYFNVILYRYGFIDGSKYTLEDIGKMYGITKEAVRRREERGLSKIRKILDERIYNGYLE